MNFDIKKLKQAVESVGCTLIKVNLMWTYCIMLPDSFPWYGAGFNEDRRKNSRIIARVELNGYDYKWRVWSMPDITICLNKPSGIEMRENDSREALLLKKFSYEQIADWLQTKIEEVSKKAKEWRKLMIAYKSKEYEA